MVAGFGKYMYDDAYDGGGDLSAAIDVSIAPFNATPDKTPSYLSGAFQDAADAAKDAGIEDLWVPRTSTPYDFQLRNHPENSSYKHAFSLWSNTRLLSDGAHLRLAPNQTLGQIGSGLIMNRHPVAGDVNVSIEGVLLDGNGANQTITHNGIHLINVQSPRIARVIARNFRGTSHLGDADETHLIGVERCTDALITRCLAERTAGSTAIGIVVQSCWGATLAQCTARGMTHSHGIASNASNDFQILGCLSYLNAYQGFNVELGSRVSCTGCIAGGIVSASGAAYPYTAGQLLGNTGNGFGFDQVDGGYLINCLAAANNAGASFQHTTTKGGVTGGSFARNVHGVALQDTLAGNVFITPETDLSNNSTSYCFRNAPGPGFMYPHGGANLAAPVNNTNFTNPYPWGIDVIPTGTFDQMWMVGPSGDVNMGGRAAYAASWHMPFGATFKPVFTGTPGWYAVW